MKNTSIVPQLPDPPLSLEDIPANPPVITQTELMAAVNAAHRFRIARADYEQKRAALTLKLLQLCEAAPGSAEVKLDEEGIVILADWSSVGPAEIWKLTPA